MPIHRNKSAFYSLINHKWATLSDEYVIYMGAFLLVHKYYAVPEVLSVNLKWIDVEDHNTIGAGALVTDYC